MHGPPCGFLIGAVWSCADAVGFALTNLAYNTDALEPYIDNQTVYLHHFKHQQAYVDNLNKFLDANPTYQVTHMVGKVWRSQVPQNLGNTTKCDREIGISSGQSAVLRKIV
jgi:superoxide dismutase